jgi:hypothetical protein
VSAGAGLALPGPAGCRTCAARCSTGPASSRRNPTQPSPIVSPRLSQPSPNISMEPGTAPANLHRLPGATVRLSVVGCGCGDSCVFT